MKDHKDLDVWIQSMLLVEDIYALTKNFPSDEKYGLSSQIKRAVVSVPSNIAEGASRKGDKEFIQFLYIAMGSLSELETQLILCNRLQFVNSIEIYLHQIEKIKKMLFGLIRYVNNK
ncbi:four helix bundle protein [Flavobacterium weaverense]|uniref:Four helix bundle protein n=1 Tax=Flavobacterium weaverense TaxID=271156 RepID=A0A3L9ZRF3_9FLAO|nr:four helix bundle protein [Flavobacterium weaverense]RMA74864.1 four helix bundle protein [Flavobacterium weaverense]